MAVAHAPFRRKLPKERKSITHQFTVGGHEGYITVGMYPDGKPGELFIVMNKQGSTISGLMDAFAIAISIGLQYNVPLEVLVDKFKHMRFEPSGYTGFEEIPHAVSIIDYIFRFLGVRFLGMEDEGTDDFSLGTPVAEAEPEPRPETGDLPLDAEAEPKA